MTLVARIATSTTPTRSRYGRKKATIRPTVRPRRSLGTGVKSRLPPPPRIPRPPTAPPVAVRVWPRGKLIAPRLRRPARQRLPGRADATTRRSVPGSWTQPLPSGRRGGLGDALGLEPALRVDGGLAAVRGRGHGLAVPMVVDVAGDEHPVDLRAGLVV